VKRLLNEDRIIYVAVICVLALLQVRSCGTLLTYKEELDLAFDANNKLRAKTLKDSSVIYSQSLRITSDARHLDSLSSELEALKMKKPEVVIQTKIKTVIKTEIALGADSLNGQAVLRLPKEFEKHEKWFSITGKINRLGTLQIDSLATNGKLTYAIGDTLRGGLFNKILRKKDKVVSLHVDNPYMQITGMNNIVVKEKKRWYESNAFMFGIGMATGFGVIAVTR
jgi:hypothetical protein